MSNEEVITSTQDTAVAEQGAHAAPAKATSAKLAGRKKAANQGTKGARKGHEGVVTKANSKKAKPVSKRVADGGVPREFSKKAIVLDLLRRKDGATMAEIAKATEWQNHSIRGFISGTVGKKMGLKVESARNAAGDRRYRVAR